jgi:hypothetical protein
VLFLQALEEELQHERREAEAAAKLSKLTQLASLQHQPGPGNMDTVTTATSHPPPPPLSFASCHPADLSAVLCFQVAKEAQKRQMQIEQRDLYLQSLKMERDNFLSKVCSKAKPGPSGGLP